MNEVEKNKQVARSYLELIGKGDVDAVVDLFTDDGAIIVESKTMLPPEVRGKEAIRGLVAMLPQIFPETGLRIIVDDVTAEENRVAIRAHSDAKHVSGKMYQNRYHFLLYFRDGKISSSHEYLDSLHLTDVFFDGARPE
ncbi:nuclear transport factor 2 family protein [Sphingomonadaceae bacterium G21617-S1]|uniref:nuclear transport factor 2 family protein n=1 Tax=Rhizorhabdus sp. TaxID=1968843 RepID=UPI00122224E1|nr:nuclear transport factor 2 family protein [Rhizorhabdus sp.]MBD3759760.1 nuclear transport factor 2 family protein [Rhizorhabdus sp.]MCZ4342245.1 nuclear transport factor 2 family protein [Sphingomonadaceae bacterium G21617-S1]TAK15762.1 MAG: nuclear transport factor 2 family protein [Rhizorhabdus sp.]